MTEDKKNQLLNEIAGYFSPTVRHLISLLPGKAVGEMSEIRLRAGQPLSLTVKGENVFLSDGGQLCYLLQSGLYTVTKKDINDTFRALCEFSEYAYKDQLKMGYIPLKNGCRAGIAARAVIENGKMVGIAEVSSINIRLAVEYKNCAIPLSKYFSGGLLIAGPPGSGKTTLLRDSVRLISCGIGTARKRVAVVDTRGEIAAVNDGVPQNDIGVLTDILTGCGKADGIEIAVRTLNPEVIAFDEIANRDEARSVISSMFSGVEAITTVHAGSKEEIFEREPARLLLESGAVKNAVYIEYPGAKPEIVCVPKAHAGLVEQRC